MDLRPGRGPFRKRRGFAGLDGRSGQQRKSGRLRSIGQNVLLIGILEIQREDALDIFIDNQKMPRHVFVGQNGERPAAIPFDLYAPQPVVVTPPPVTLGVLLEAAEAGLPAVWLQDGSFDDAVLALAATSPFKTVHHACIMVESND